jgi:LysR family transcriptional regulator, hydrogen peroxide-inducible genes activator
MQMHQVRYFLALLEERSFTRAARRSGVSQPSLTNAISALEQELGGVLFHRKPLVALTELGHALAPYLEQIAHNAERACDTARAWRDVRIADCEALQSAVGSSDVQHDRPEPPLSTPGL